VQLDGLPIPEPSTWTLAGLGAFSLLAFRDVNFDMCLFSSPILNMQRLIENMMRWFNVTPEQLQAQREIPTPIGETLSWDYYCYVREHTVDVWNSPTAILYPELDNLTEPEAEAFAPAGKSHEQYEGEDGTLPRIEGSRAVEDPPILAENLHQDEDQQFIAD